MARLNPLILEEMGLTPIWVRRDLKRPELALAHRAADECAVDPSNTMQPDTAHAIKACRDFNASADEPLNISAPTSQVRRGAAQSEPHSAEAASESIDLLDWDALAARVAHCTRCRLCEKRTRTVFGVGDPDADWLLVGEAPGANEDRLGEPFVGQAGRLLDNMLRAVGLMRGRNVYIANIIKCRPPGNRDPHPDEVAQCAPYLRQQIALIRPKLILALGRFAAQSLLETHTRLSSLRARIHRYEHVPVIVTYHPAYLLRNLSDKAKAWTDLCLAQETYQSLSRH